jgi:signal transduction histidine kinase
MMPMALESGRPAIRWYRSFYFRIGFSFVVFVVAVLVAQSVVFNLLLMRPRFPGRSPNALAAIVAADVGSAIGQDPALDVDEYLKREYPRLPPAYAVMKTGAVGANRSSPLRAEILRSAEGMLGGTDFRRAGPVPAIGGPPFVMAPIQVAGELKGVVVLPPPMSANPITRDVFRLFTVPGTALLIVGTVLAAAFIFAPARRRLRMLQEATRRLGAGDLSARAPETGGDEVADVAATFNSMARELAARDEALRASDRLRRQMLADVSHELKTPLTAMRGYVETLHMSDVVLDAATRERYFATLERETFRLDRIVKDLLDLARLENGVGDLDARTFAIGRVFEHVAQRHEQDATTRDVAIRSRVAEAADQIVADPDRIEQVVENLFANALRHTPDGGSIELAADASDDAVVISVADSGSGIPPGDIPHVFERFYKADPARTSGSDGSGLGLSIAKAIVERHGGTIDVKSRPGRTVFTIQLPKVSGRQSTSANLYPTPQAVRMSSGS